MPSSLSTEIQVPFVQWNQHLLSSHKVDLLPVGMGGKLARASEIYMLLQTWLSLIKYADPNDKYEC